MRRERRGALERLVPLGAWILYPCLRLLAASWRTVWAEGSAGLDGVAAAESPAVYAFWHNRLYPCTLYVHRFLGRRGRGLAALVSLSRDGELAARMGRLMGIEVVRGSTSRAGLSGLRQLHRAIARRGLSVVTAPDGPRGPVYRCQAGTVVLAATTAAPVIPLAAAADRAWRLASWDRMIVPKPFARVALAVGEPLPVGKRDDPDEAAERLGAALDRLVAACEARLE